MLSVHIYYVVVQNYLHIVVYNFFYFEGYKFFLVVAYLQLFQISCCRLCRLETLTESNSRVSNLVNLVDIQLYLFFQAMCFA